MKYPEWNSSRFVLLFSLFLIVLFQANCAKTPAEQGRQALEEAAQAMGGLEALRAIENISREGTTQPSSLGQARTASERLYVQPSRPYTQIIDFTVPRQVEMTGAAGIIRVTDWEKGGYRESRGTVFPLEPRHLNGTRKEWDRDIAKFLVYALVARGRSTFSELRWYPPMEAAKGSLSWVFRAKQPESVRTGP